MPARTTASPAGEREVLRLTGPVILWWIWLVFVAVNVADFAIQGLSSARFGAVVSAILLCVTGLAYALALRPRVVTDAIGVTVVNPFRTHRIPWRLITSVDTGEWVRLHWAAEAAGAAAGAAAEPPAGTRTLHCWALYVSARARRKAARAGRPRPGTSTRQRRGRLTGILGRWPTADDAGVGGYASPSSSSRLPDEARYLASLPVAKAMAARLGTRAARERARKARAGQQPERATASWSVPALAAAVIPALILLIVALA